MKKCTLLGLILILLLSCCSVYASAEELPSHAGWTVGAYLGGSADLYSPIGDVTVAWKPDFSSKIDLTDGDLADWYNAGLQPTNITVHNMISWVGNVDSVQGDWKITTFSAADPTYLYLAFDVVDADFAYGSNDFYNGDAIQLALDFGNRLSEIVKTDPDNLGGNCRDIFYCFSCLEDGAPIRIMRQESEQDACLSEANGDGVKGAARRTEMGWSAELAISWEQIYDDYCFKAWEDPNIYVGYGAEIPLKIGASLYYVNRAETGGDVLWAAGAIQEWTDDEGNPCVSWTTYDNGITWVLPYQKGMSFGCDGIIAVGSCLSTIPTPDEGETETLLPETETWWGTAEDLPIPMPPDEYEQWEETIRDAAESMGQEDELEAILAKYGCTSAVGAGGMALLAVMIAAAYVTKKK